MRRRLLISRIFFDIPPVPAMNWKNGEDYVKLQRFSTYHVGFPFNKINGLALYANPFIQQYYYRSKFCVRDGPTPTILTGQPMSDSIFSI